MVISYVGVADGDMILVKWIEVHAIGSSNVHTTTDVCVVGLLDAVDFMPGHSSICCFHRAIPIGDDGDISVTGVDTGFQKTNVFSAEGIFHPGIGEVFYTLTVFDSVSSGTSSAFPDPLPGLAGIACLEGSIPMAHRTFFVGLHVSVCHDISMRGIIFCGRDKGIARWCVVLSVIGNVVAGSLPVLSIVGDPYLRFAKCFTWNDRGWIVKCIKHEFF